MNSFRPRITTQVPDGWSVKESLTLIDDDRQANVIASGEPLDAEITSESYAEVQGELLRTEFPGYKELSFGETKLFEGRSGFVRTFEWTPPDSPPVTQVQLYYAEGGRGYTATATTPTEQFHKFEATLLDVLRRLTLAS